RIRSGDAAAADFACVSPPVLSPRRSASGRRAARQRRRQRLERGRGARGILPACAVAGERSALRADAAPALPRQGGLADRGRRRPRLYRTAYARCLGLMPAKADGNALTLD